MKLLSETGIRFIIGAGLAILIGFLFWWFIVHNESDRIVEKSFQEFYNALDEACTRYSLSSGGTKENPVRVYVKLPQKTFAGLLDEINRLFSKTSGIVTKTFEDPYYTFHWEFFPPEPPYEITDVMKMGIAGVPGTLAAFFIPWREDLPWSQNLLLTMGIYTFVFGFDLLGIGEMKAAAKKLAQNSEVVEGMMKTGEAVVKGTKFVVKETKMIIKETIEIGLTAGMITFMCYVSTDLPLEKCLEMGIAGAIIFKVGTYLIKKFVIPKIKTAFKKVISKATQKIKSYFGYVKDEIKEGLATIRNSIFGDKDLVEKFGNHLDNLEDYLDELDEAIKAGNKQEVKEILEDISDEIDETYEVLIKIKETNPEVYEELYARLSLELDDIGETVSEAKHLIDQETLEDLYTKGVKIKLDDFESYAESISEEIVVKPTKKALKKAGFVEENGKLILKDPQNENFQNFESYAKYYKEKYGKLPERVGDFELRYDPTTGKLKEVVYDPETIGKRFREKTIDPLMNTLKISASKNLISAELVDASAAEKASLILKYRLEENPELADEFCEVLGMDKKELFSNLEDLYDASKNSVGIVVGANTRVPDFVEKLATMRVEESSREIVDEYLLEYVKKLKSDAAEREAFKRFLQGKDYGLKEFLAATIRRSPIGFAFLSAIDLYTPLGATWWDIQLSYYGYEGRRLPTGCQPSCERGKICYQLGACFREYDLPQSCKKLGIKNMKLERDSIVAKNPRFYLVSPCYGEAQIYIDGDERTIFVKVLLDPNKQPNYCYAYKMFVDYYILYEASEKIARCVIAVVCAATSLDIPSAILVCLTGNAGGLCGLLVDIIGFATEVFKETFLVWPTVYQNFPGFADWMS